MVQRLITAPHVVAVPLSTPANTRSIDKQRIKAQHGNEHHNPHLCLVLLLSCVTHPGLPDVDWGTQ